MDFIIMPFGWLMRLLYNVVNNYGFALLLFTLITQLLMLPLNISQQKSMARMTVYNPLIQEIQKKYANNREKQQEELTKLYTEYGIKPTTGCLPLLIQFPLIMILYEVIQKPLRYLVGLSAASYNSAVALAGELGGTGRYMDAFIVAQIQGGSTAFNEAVGTHLSDILDLDFTLFGIRGMDLTAVPTFGLNLLMLVPLLSAVSMILSQYITGRVTGQRLHGVTAVMMYGLSLWVGYLGFTFPAALSLYWFYSNVMGLIKSLALRRYYNPEKFKAQIQAELEAKRAEKKRKKTVSYVDETTGERVEKAMSDAEIAKLRLARARALQEEKYRRQEEEARKAAEKAAQEDAPAEKAAPEQAAPAEDESRS